METFLLVNQFQIRAKRTSSFLFFSPSPLNRDNLSLLRMGELNPSYPPQKAPALVFAETLSPYPCSESSPFLLYPVLFLTTFFDPLPGQDDYVNHLPPPFLLAENQSPMFPFLPPAADNIPSPPPTSPPPGWSFSPHSWQIPPFFLFYFAKNTGMSFRSSRFSTSSWGNRISLPPPFRFTHSREEVGTLPPFPAQKDSHSFSSFLPLTLKKPSSPLPSWTGTFPPPR